MKLKGRRALVTGGATGIGFACARRLAEAGVNLSIADSDVDALKLATRNLRAGYPVDVTSHSCDVGRADHQEALLGVVGAIDVLVNTSGAFPAGDLAAVDDELWRSAWDRKLFAAINLARLVMPGMADRRGGVIVNLLANPLTELQPQAVELAVAPPASQRIAGVVGNAALAEFTRVLGSASVADGIRVVGVDPGPTITDELGDFLADEAERRLGDRRRWWEMLATNPIPNRPEDVADLVCFLTSERAGPISGTVVEASPSRL